MVVDEVMDAISVYGRRSLRIVTRLVDMHLELAQRELSLEQRRIISASIVLSIGTTLMMSGITLMQVIFVLWIYQTRSHWLIWSASLVGGDIIIGAFFLWIALQQLRGPYMQETLRQMTKTASLLTQDGYDE